MPAYLSQIAAEATAAGASGRTLLPVIRSRSPIAERDQRLRLTDADWGFDESLPASDAAFGEMASPGTVASPGRETPAPRGQSPLLPHQAPENRVPASPSPIEISLNAPEPAGSEVPASARAPLSSGHAIIDPRRPEVARHEPERHAAGLRTNAGSKSPGFTLAEANVDRRATGPSTPSRVSTPRLEVVAAGETDPTEPVVFQNKPRCAGEPATAIDVLSSARHSVPARSSEPLAKAPAGHGKMAPVKTSLEPVPSGVVIGRIEVEVVPPTTEKAAAKTAPRQPVRSGPISQIGPLGGGAKHLAFAIRHR
jgi:hypothetical protein